MGPAYPGKSTSRTELGDVHRLPGCGRELSGQDFEVFRLGDAPGLAQEVGVGSQCDGILDRLVCRVRFENRNGLTESGLGFREARLGCEDSGQCQSGFGRNDGLGRSPNDYIERAPGQPPGVQ